MTSPGPGESGTTPFGRHTTPFDAARRVASDDSASRPTPTPGPFFIPEPLDATAFSDAAAFSDAMVGVPEHPLVVIGDITCTQHYIVTPSGTFPIAGSQWEVTDMSMSTERTSTTGVVLAVVGFFLVCFLSLLFLLAKERRTTGYIQVRVRGAHGGMHVTNIPAHSPLAMAEVSGRVNYARNLAAMA